MLACSHPVPRSSRHPQRRCATTQGRPPGQGRAPGWRELGNPYAGLWKVSSGRHLPAPWPFSAFKCLRVCTCRTHRSHMQGGCVQTGAALLGSRHVFTGPRKALASLHFCQFYF